jgi:hypothetical protein
MGTPQATDFRALGRDVEARLGPPGSNLAPRPLTSCFLRESADRSSKLRQLSAAADHPGPDLAATCRSYHRENADRPLPLPLEKVVDFGNVHLFDLPYCSFASASTVSYLR